MPLVEAQTAKFRFYFYSMLVRPPINGIKKPPKKGGFCCTGEQT